MRNRQLMAGGSAKLMIREEKAFQKWQDSDDPEVDAPDQIEMFELFLAGKTTPQIQKKYPRYNLGQVVAARIMGQWDLRRQEYVSQMLEETKARVQQVTLESSNFFLDLITAANKHYGQQVQRFLETGDPDDMDQIKIKNLKDYREAIEMLQKLTGQDKTHHQHITVEKTAVPAPVVEEEEAPQIIDINGPPTADDAAAVLKMLKNEKK